LNQEVTHMPMKDSWKIDAGKTAFITVDFEDAFMHPGGRLVIDKARDFMPTVNELSALCRSLKMPVMHLGHYVRPDMSDMGLMQEIRPPANAEYDIFAGGKGTEFYKDLKVDKTDYVVHKIRYSPFITGSSNLEPLLRGLGRDSFILCGILTDICVAMTTCDAMMLGFRVFVVGDLTATLTDERQKISLQVLDRNFCKVTDSKQVKADLLALKKAQ
jgi:ureidoacrylate peracid hydrolase